MKTVTLLALITLLFLVPLAGQSSSLIDKAKFTAIISFTENPNFRQKGKLYNTCDSTISLINPYSYKTRYKFQIKTSSEDLFVAENELLRIQVNRIDHVYLRKDGNIIKGVMVGALVGAVTGIFIGQYIGNDHPTARGFTSTENEKSSTYGMLLGLTGGLAGGIIGANIRVVIPISGRQQEYQRIRPRLNVYMLSGPH